MKYFTNVQNGNGKEAYSETGGLWTIGFLRIQDTPCELKRKSTREASTDNEGPRDRGIFCLLWPGFVVSRFLFIFFTITEVKKIVCYRGSFYTGSTVCNHKEYLWPGKNYMYIFKSFAKQTEAIPNQCTAATSPQNKSERGRGRL